MYHVVLCPGWRLCILMLGGMASGLVGHVWLCMSGLRCLIVTLAFWPLVGACLECRVVFGVFGAQFGFLVF
jgi:hypothetical protein